MKYWKDEYLESLTATEPFRGLREENKDITIGAAIQKLAENNSDGILIITNGPNPTHAFYINKSNKFPYTKKSGSNTNIFKSPGNSDEPFNFKDAFLYTKNQNKAHQALTDIGWERQKDAMNESQWNAINIELQKKFGKNWGSEVAASVAKSLDVNEKPSWYGTGGGKN